MEDEQPKRQQGDKYILRFPPGMRERLHEDARANARSLNAELVKRLQDTLDGRAIVLPEEIRQRLVDRAARHGWPLESELLHTLVDSLNDYEDDSQVRQQIAHVKATHATELEVLRDTMRSQQKSSDIVAGAGIMMAQMIRRCIELLPADVKKKHPEVRVWEASADAVVHGNARLLMEALGQLDLGEAEAVASAPRERAVYDRRKKPAAKKR